MTWIYGDGYRYDSNRTAFETVRGLRFNLPADWTLEPDETVPIAGRDEHRSEVTLHHRKTQTRIHVVVQPNSVAGRWMERPPLQAEAVATPIGQFPLKEQWCDDRRTCATFARSVGGMAVSFLVEPVMVGEAEGAFALELARSILAKTPVLLSAAEIGALADAVRAHQPTSCYDGQGWSAPDFADRKHGVRWVAPKSGIWRGRIGPEAKSNVGADLGLPGRGEHESVACFEDVLSGMRVLIASQRLPDNQDLGYTEYFLRRMHLEAFHEPGVDTVIRGAEAARSMSGERQPYGLDHREVVAIRGENLVRVHVWGPIGSLALRSPEYDAVVAGISFAVQDDRVECRESE